MSGKGTYRAAVIPDGPDKILPAFLEYLYQGRLSLLRYENRYFTEQDGEIAELIQRKDTIEENGRLLILDVPVFRQQLLDQMKDCATVSGRVLAARLQYRSLVELFEQYYACTEEKPLWVPENTREFQVRLGLGLRTHAFKMHFSEDRTPISVMENNEHPYRLDLDLPRVMVEIAAPQLNRRMTARLGIGYNRMQYEFENEFEQFNILFYNQFLLDFTYLEFPVQLTYDLTRNPLPIYISANGSFEPILSWESTLNSRLTPGNESGRQFTGASQVMRYGGSLGIRLGQKGYTGFAELSYDRSTGLSMLQGMNSVLRLHISRIGLGAGVFF